jgi:hypothetical protein
VLQRNKECNIDWDILKKYGLPKEARTLMENFLAENPNERISAEEALKHYYFTDLNN